MRRPVPTDQHQLLPHPHDDLLGQVAILDSRFLTLDDVDSLEESHSSDISHIPVG